MEAICVVLVMSSCLIPYGQSGARLEESVVLQLHVETVDLWRTEDRCVKLFASGSTRAGLGSGVCTLVPVLSRECTFMPSNRPRSFCPTLSHPPLF